MYYSEYDRVNNLLVCRITAGGDEQADIVLHLERMVEACSETALGKPKAAVLAIFDSGRSVPKPLLRKKIAEVTGHRDFVLHMAVVSENPLIRGVITALSWLRKARFDVTVVSTLPKALSWLEKMRDEPLPKMTRMISEVNRQMVDNRRDRAVS